MNMPKRTKADVDRIQCLIEWWISYYKCGAKAHASAAPSAIMIKLKQRSNDAAQAVAQAEAVANKATKKAQRAQREKSARAFAKEEAKRQSEELLERVNTLQQEKNQLVKRLRPAACDDDDGSIESDDQHNWGGGRGDRDGRSRGINKRQRSNESDKNTEKANGAGNTGNGQTRSSSSSSSSTAISASGHNHSCSSRSTVSASPQPDTRVDAIVKEMGDLKSLLVQLVSNQQAAQVCVRMSQQCVLTSTLVLQSPTLAMAQSSTVAITPSGNEKTHSPETAKIMSVVEAMKGTSAVRTATTNFPQREEQRAEDIMSTQRQALDGVLADYGFGSLRSLQGQGGVNLTFVNLPAQQRRSRGPPLPTTDIDEDYAPPHSHYQPFYQYPSPSHFPYHHSPRR